MEFEILEARLNQKHILRNLLELYLYDFSEMCGDDLDDEGAFGYPYLDRYWVEEGRYPFLLRVAGKWAGFVLVRDTLAPGGEASPQGEASPCGEMVHTIAEFFVMRKYRRMGLGRQAARAIFDRFAGRWQVSELTENLGAQAFWRKVIGEYTGGRFDEITLPGWNGPVQEFIAPGQ